MPITEQEFKTIIQTGRWVLRHTKRPNLFVHQDSLHFVQTSEHGFNLYAKDSDGRSVLRKPIALNYYLTFEEGTLKIPEEHVLATRNDPYHNRVMAFFLREEDYKLKLVYNGDFVPAGQSPDEEADGDPT